MQTIVFVVSIITIVMLFWLVNKSLRKDLRACSPSYQPIAKKKPQGAERREHTRAEVKWPVKITTDAGEMEGYMKDISVGGAFVCCESPLRCKEIFRLRIDVPDRQPLEATSEVVWSNLNAPQSDLLNRGMGVRFIQIAEEDRKFISNLVEACAAHAENAGNLAI